jgi:hypothetical protein
MHGMDGWTRARWWLVGWLFVTAVCVGVTTNRLMNVMALLEIGRGFPALPRDLLMEAAGSMVFALATAVIAFVPSAWAATGRVPRSYRRASNG